MSSSPSIPDFPISERMIVLIAGMIQFVNILDFMIVMPLGPDFAQALGMAVSDVGLIGGTYTFAAAVAGLLFAPFLDRYGRRQALLFFLMGLTVSTLAAAFVETKEQMLMARVAAGVFGGPVTALAISLVSDFVPPARRGRAMGKVMGGFALASVFGVPIALELAGRFSWHTPFIVTAALAFMIVVMVYAVLPRQAPLAGAALPLRAQIIAIRGLFTRRRVLLSYAFMGLGMMAAFMIIPNIAAHVQMNLGYPREKLGLLYLAGGAFSFVFMQLAGPWIDKTSASFMAGIFIACLSVVIFVGFVIYPTPVPVIVIFTGFMMMMSARGLSTQTLTSKVPMPHERGAYMSVQGAVVHLSGAIGSASSSLVLVEKDGHLLHMPVLGIAAIAISACVPFLMRKVENDLTPTELAAAVPVVEDALASHSATPPDLR